MLPESPETPEPKLKNFSLPARQRAAPARRSGTQLCHQRLGAPRPRAPPRARCPRLPGLQPRRPAGPSNTYPAGCCGHRLHRGPPQVSAALGAPQRPCIARRPHAPRLAGARCPARRTEPAGRVPRAGGRVPTSLSRPPASRVPGTRGPTAARGALTADARLTAHGAAAALGHPRAPGQRSQPRRTPGSPRPPHRRNPARSSHVGTTPDPGAPPPAPSGLARYPLATPRTRPLSYHVLYSATPPLRSLAPTGPLCVCPQAILPSHLPPPKPLLQKPRMQKERWLCPRDPESQHSSLSVPEDRLRARAWHSRVRASDVMF